MKKFFLILFLVFIEYIATAQYFWGGLDTLDMRKLSSSGIIIRGTKDSLFSTFGKPDRIIKQRPLALFKQKDSTIVRDTIVFFNYLDYYSKDGVSYYEKDNKVYISSVDFSKKKNLVIYHPKIVLKRNLTLDDFQKIFPHATESIQIYKSYLLPYKARKKEIAYNVAFLTGGKHGHLIELYFDRKKRLRYIEFPFEIYED